MNFFKKKRTEFLCPYFTNSYSFIYSDKMKYIEKLNTIIVINKNYSN